MVPHDTALTALGKSRRGDQAVQEESRSVESIAGRRILLQARSHLFLYRHSRLQSKNAQPAFDIRYRKLCIVHRWHRHQLSVGISQQLSGLLPAWNFKSNNQFSNRRFATIAVQISNPGNLTPGRRIGKESAGVS